MRQVSGQLGVNQMTISKAYSILESGDVLECFRDIGMIVVATTIVTMKVDKDRIELLKLALKEAAKRGKQLALPHDLILDTFRKIMEEK